MGARIDNCLYRLNFEKQLVTFVVIFGVVSFVKREPILTAFFRDAELL